MRLIRVGLILCVLAAALAYSVDWQGLGIWASGHQRGFQDQMAQAIRAIQTGESGALLTLFAGAGAYGFFHAVGPGHGKAVIGGVGLGTTVTAKRLLSLSVLSSLLQALWAIALVYGAFWILELSAHQMTSLAERVLAPISYLAIAGIGGFLVWRGLRTLNSSGSSKAHVHHPHDTHDHGHTHSHDHEAEACGCHPHAHGPSLEDVESLTSWRDTLSLIFSIAIRPCTGAIFLLVIAWQMNIPAAGAAAVVVMGLGTASFTSLVAVSSVAARTATFATSGRFNVLAQAIPVLQILAGGFVLWISLTLLRATL